MTNGLPLALLAAGVLLASHAACGREPDQPVIVTSDSRDYCHTLSLAIERHRKLPAEVRELKAQGDGLCRDGRVRGGIKRLRQALLVLHERVETQR